MLKNLIESSDWPNAIDENLLCRTESDYSQKARAILEMLVDEDLENKNIFDYSGITVPIISHYGAKCDKQKKFDIVILYDVIDHVKNPFLLMQQINEIITKQTKIFIRCHPWTSRHADHDLSNKAYKHLFNYQKSTNRKLHHNKVSYDLLFKNYQVAFKREVRQYLEPFFVLGEGQQFLHKIFKSLPDNIQYIDYKLFL